jgi:hypothetical protein
VSRDRPNVTVDRAQMTILVTMPAQEAAASDCKLKNTVKARRNARKQSTTPGGLNLKLEGLITGFCRLLYH